jgi:hypothetical protein
MPLRKQLKIYNTNYTHRNKQRKIKKSKEVWQAKQHTRSTWISDMSGKSILKFNEVTGERLNK